MSKSSRARVRVEAYNNESLYSLMRRFKNAVEKDGSFEKSKEYQYYEKPNWKRRRKLKEQEINLILSEKKEKNQNNYYNYL